MIECTHCAHKICLALNMSGHIDKLAVLCQITKAKMRSKCASQKVVALIGEVIH